MLSHPRGIFPPTPAKRSANPDTPGYVLWRLLKGTPLCALTIDFGGRGQIIDTVEDEASRALSRAVVNEGRVCQVRGRPRAGRGRA
jgi:hypothetical protein